MIVVRFSIVLTIMWLFEQMMWLCFLAVFSRVESTLVEGRLRSRPTQSSYPCARSASSTVTLRASEQSSCACSAMHAVC